jgi:hypothetical protein
MFGKDKVKGHNRVTKGKSGFKVIRVDDFFRKKDDSRGKKIALGVAGTGLLLGAGLLAKKKGLKLPSFSKKASDMVIDVKATRVPETNLLSSGKKIRNLVTTKPQEKYLIKTPKTNKKTGVNIPVISQEAKDYQNLPLPMKVTLQMEKALLAPTRKSLDGRPPESTSLSKILNPKSKLSVDKIIKKAKRKVQARLLREKDIQESK